MNHAAVFDEAGLRARFADAPDQPFRIGAERLERIRRVAGFTLW